MTKAERIKQATDRLKGIQRFMHYDKLYIIDGDVLYAIFGGRRYRQSKISLELARRLIREGVIELD